MKSKDIFLGIIYTTRIIYRFIKTIVFLSIFGYVGVHKRQLRIIYFLFGVNFVKLFFFMFLRRSTAFLICLIKVRLFLIGLRRIEVPFTNFFHVCFTGCSVIHYGVYVTRFGFNFIFIIFRVRFLICLIWFIIAIKFKFIITRSKFLFWGVPPLEIFMLGISVGTLCTLLNLLNKAFGLLKFFDHFDDLLWCDILIFNHLVKRIIVYCRTSCHKALQKFGFY